MGEQVERLVFCPILKKEIDNHDDCFIIVSVAEQALPKDYAPKELWETANWQDICNNCKYKLDRQG